MENILRTLFALALLLPATSTLAGELSTVVNGKSFHIGASKDWNESNFGAGIEYQFDTNSKWKTLVLANGLRDSYSNMSYMAGGALHRNLYSSDALGGLYVDLGMTMFLMSRQNVNDGRLFPGALPSMAIGNRYMGLNISYLPMAAIKKITPPKDLDKTMKGVVFVQFKFNVSRLLPFKQQHRLSDRSATQQRHLNASLSAPQD